MAPPNIKPAIRALLVELYKLTDPAYFTDEQLASAKKILAVQSIYEQEKTTGLVNTVSFWWASAGLNYYFDYVKNLNAITREDISQFIKTYVLGKPFVLGLLIDEVTMNELKLDQAALDAYVKEVVKELDEKAAADAKAKTKTPAKKGR